MFSKIIEYKRQQQPDGVLPSFSDTREKIAIQTCKDILCRQSSRD